MAFLDNSGDIILDAVLTDLGRKRLAAGNFNIAKFALGDEEVNYALWNTSDTRGSAFYDLEIMQTPLLEAFTSDQSLMKSRLLTLVDDTLLYMPTLKLNTTDARHKPYPGFEGYYLMADTKTYEVGNLSGRSLTDAGTTGVLHGTPGVFGPTTHICVDQGIDSGDSSMTIADHLPGELLERAYIIKVDHRLMRLEGLLPGQGGENTVTFNESFIDDDGIATYYVVSSQDQSPIMGPRDSIGRRQRDQINQTREQSQLATIDDHEMFDGPLGTVLRFLPRASDLVARGESLFNEFGNVSSTSLSLRGGTIDAGYKFIDTAISVAGATTGYSIDIPIRIIKGIDFS